MGIKSFFKRTGNWLKDKFHTIKNGVTKFAKVAAPVIKKGVDFIDKTPIAPMVNAYTGGLFDKAKKLIDFLPDGAVKDKLNAYSGKAEEMRNRVVDEIDKRQNQARDMIDKGRNVMGVITSKVPTPPM